MKYETNHEKILDIFAFKNWCAGSCFVVTYRGSEQEYHNPTGTIKLEAEFGEILVFCVPNSIVLKSEDCVIRFECVEKVGMIKTGEGQLAINIYCSSYDCDTVHKIKISKISY